MGVSRGEALLLRRRVADSRLRTAVEGLGMALGLSGLVAAVAKADEQNDPTERGILVTDGLAAIVESILRLGRTLEPRYEPYDMEGED